MLDIGSAEMVLRVERILQAVDISPVLDNCFFHALALYFLANKLPFPEDLSASSDNDGPVLGELKARFPSIESLQLFYDYALATSPGADRFPHHLVEKTIILGIFLRSWFIQRLRESPENYQARFKHEDGQDEQGADESHITFMRLVEDYRVARLRDIDNPQGGAVASFLMQVEHNPIYEANSAFIRELPLGADEELCRSYWESVGYGRYCAYLNANVKMSYGDVAVILKDLRIPYVIYNHENAALITQHRPEPQDDTPVFELALHAREGHYYLLKTEDTSEVLERYRAQYASYRREREQLQNIPNCNYVALAKRGTAQFLAATLPFDNTGHDPLDLVALRVRELDQGIQQRVQQHSRPQTNVRRDGPPPSTRSVHRSALIRPSGDESQVGVRKKISSKVNAAPDPTSAEKIPKTEKRRISPRCLAQNKAFNEQIRRIRISLDLLLAKKSSYERKKNIIPEELLSNGEENEKEIAAYIKKYEDAIKAVDALHEAIFIALGAYEADPTQDNYLIFKQVSEQAIIDYKPEIAKHRDDHQFYGNLLGFIVGLGVLYGLFLLGNVIWNGGRCTMFKTDGEQRVDQVEDDINALTAPGA